ncbi:YihY/virulence factor BrkB family protein [Myroides odoratus]|uniref:YihY/virulence factor BrkB family protein n=1 Tax=Myroides odoratus TaxID=256 RepID=A0A9Q6Z8Z5_MYROD|nr:YihY/virulence factor BrkB family protein [Myroides odoratus]EHQ40893.1 ribonuclease BN [Myroides odoratus DSM 2801]EHQ44559.1 ribonuclease BN [Myroides odoratus DSM 2801]EKB08200.1 YihY family protein [Myroides odoratus CIP 103059]QQU01842.1 YihY/virulence factor BrkB family protein [Myroides odoratus]WQD55870.1 YihY/virulence factor BrkB family protein [Myroides odoratus]
MIHIPFKKIGTLLKDSVMDFLDDRATKFSAALSYYTIFALPPLIILIISASGFFIEEKDVSAFFYQQVSDLVGPNTAREVENAMNNVTLNRSGVLPTVIGVAMLLFSASGVFAEIQSSINYIWGFVAKPEKSVIRMVKNRLLSFAMIASVGFLLLVSLLINSLASILYDYLAEFFAESTIYLVKVLNNAIVFVLITFLFALIFKTLPNGIIRLKDAFVGAAFTAVLFMIGKWGIGIYLGTTATSSLYGAAGSIIVMLMWVYYSAMILYFGAEFTKNYALLFGERIRPGQFSLEIDKNAIKTVEEQKV